MRPFPFLPGEYYLLTRDLSGRKHRLKPTELHCAIFLFLALRYANRCGIKIYALTLMSTHYHMVVCDPEGRLAEFVRDFHSRVAFFFNLLHERTGVYWEAGDRIGRCRLEDDDAILRKMLYTFLNPTQDGITPHAQQWPGILISPQHYGQKVTLECPDFLVEQGYNYDAETYRFERPSCYSHLSDAQARADIFGRVRIQQQLIARKRNKPFLGVAKAMATPIDTVSPPHEPGINPKFATRDRDLMKATLAWYRAWCHEYEIARQQFLAGNRNVIWPAGTWAKHHLDGCPRH